MKTLQSLFVSIAVLAAGLFFAPVTLAAPEIEVRGNYLEIINGDSSPRTQDFTFFGVQTVGAGSLTRIFTITNLGADILSPNGTPLVSGGRANPDDYVVSVPPTLTTLGTGQSTTFQEIWTPTSGGFIHNVDLTIPNTDSDENPYNFAIQATAILTLNYAAGPNGWKGEPHFVL